MVEGGRRLEVSSLSVTMSGGCLLRARYDWSERGSPAPAVSGAPSAAAPTPSVSSSVFESCFIHLVKLAFFAVPPRISQSTARSWLVSYWSKS